MLTEGHIQKALTELWTREKAFETAVEEDATAEHLYKTEKAAAFLRAEGTEKAREAQSIVESSELFLDHLKKKATKEFTREKLRDAQNAVSARQSLLKYEAQTNFGMMGSGS